MSEKPERIESVVSVFPRDPLVFRDARSVANAPGARSFGLSWPLPRSLAGAMRSHIGNTNDFKWTTRGGPLAARAISCHGPLLVSRKDNDAPWTTYVPAPRDLVLYRPEDRPHDLAVMRLVPMNAAADADCDLPKRFKGDPTTPVERAMANTDLRPLSITEDTKPAKGMPQWWQLDDAVRWLHDVDSRNIELPASLTVEQRNDEDADANIKVLRGLNEADLDVRTHVSIDSPTGISKEGALFATEGRVFSDFAIGSRRARAMICRIGMSSTNKCVDDSIALGGEGRVSALRFNDPAMSWPTPPTGLFVDEKEIEGIRGIRLLMVTPALFKHGWLPGWLNDGVIPGMGGMSLPIRLVGVASDRPVPVSGWRMAANMSDGDKAARKPGPRATRYAVPSGSVYFFEFSQNKPTLEQYKQIWEQLWLRPVSDSPSDCDEGFGLVLPGLWSAAPQEDKN